MAEIFDAAQLANDAAKIHIKLGRVQFASEVKEIIGTWAVHKPAETVILELQALCRKETA